MKEGKGRGKSIAETHSLNLAWELLMQDQYKDLRTVIYTTTAEYDRFRSVFVSVVLSTDIMDADLAAARRERWQRAFAEGFTSSRAVTQSKRHNRATIIIEHLIQASDVAHTVRGDCSLFDRLVQNIVDHRHLSPMPPTAIDDTHPVCVYDGTTQMQHWHLYRKWNERLFYEMCDAFQEGRAETNPGDSWYKGEIAFLQSYVIPLATKLRDCGVYGSIGEEYLRCAELNLAEWKLKGPDLVEEMIVSYQEHKQQQDSKNSSCQPKGPGERFLI